jgi:hypothetical protein
MKKVNFSASTFLSLLVMSLGILSFSSSSTRSEIREPEMRYRNCAQLQKRMNDNNPHIKFRSFEGAILGRRMYADNVYMVYCNNGAMVNTEKRIMCKGYIGYSYDPTIGTAEYYGSWGWTDGTPNGADGDKGHYCRKIK